MKNMFSRALLARLPKPLSCRVVAPLLAGSEEPGGTMTGADRFLLAVHLADCAACRDEAETTRVLGTLLRRRGPTAMPPAVPSPDLWARIEQRIIAGERVTPRSPTVRPLLLLAPAFVAVIAAFVLVPRFAAVTGTSAPEASAKMVAISLPAASPALPSRSPMTVTMDERAVSRPASRASAPAPEMAATAPSASEAMTADQVSTPMAAPLPRRAVRVADAASKPRDITSHRAVKNPVAYEVIEVVSAERPERHTRKVARYDATPVATPEPITIVDVPAPLADTATHAASTFANSTELTRRTTATNTGSIPTPRRAAPTVAWVADTGNNRAITVVSTNTGTGVSSLAYAPPTVTDSLIRQRQKRGLFGGYGTGGVAVPATTTGAATGGTGGETASPW